MDEEIKECVANVINNHHLVKINNQVYLKQYQKDILDYYHIDYQNCSSISEILFLIDDVLENDEVDVDALEEVSMSLQEFQYYCNTNK